MADNETEYQAAFKAGQNCAPHRAIDKNLIQESRHPFMVVPVDSRIEDLQKYLPKPIRAKANPTFYNPHDFIEYFNKFKTDNTMLFYDLATGHIRAVFDYHVRHNSLSWCDFRAAFGALPTPEWTRWSGNNNVKMPQEKFAEFIEENTLNIIEPEPAAVLESCLTLHAKKEGVFKSGLMLNNGSFEFTYDEKVVSQGTGKIEFPNHFILKISPFHGSEPVQVKVILRYRIHGGELKLFYKILDPDKIVEKAFQWFVDLVADKTKYKPMYCVE